MTLHEAIKAADQLETEGIFIRVVDLFSVKPIDVETLEACPNQTKRKVLTVEDHRKEGGIYEAIAGSLPGMQVYGLAVDGIPRSGKPAELLRLFKIDSLSIIQKVKEIKSTGTH